MNAKKIPLRKCVGCGELKPRTELIRVIRTEDGQTTVDPTGRMNGRGAYICRCGDCLEKARKRHSLEHSLRAAIPPEIYLLLEKERGILEQ